MDKDLSALFVGLGSIGSRHLRDLVAVCTERGLRLSVDALRHAGAAPLAESIRGLVRTEYRDIGSLGTYDLIFICNPSQLHEATLEALKDKARHFFVEKPAFVRPLAREREEAFSDESKFFVACPLRFTKVYSYLETFVKEHRVFSARAVCSSYLPEWRPNQDYRSLYSARPESGGVKLDLIHEFDYLFALFGIPPRHFIAEGKFSDLEIASNDTVAFVGEYDDKVVEVHLDYHGRQPQRFVELNTRDDTVRCDFLRSEVQFLRAGTRLSFGESREDYCRREIAYFLDFAVGEKKNVNSILRANRVLSVLQG